MSSPEIRTATGIPTGLPDLELPDVDPRADDLRRKRPL